MANEPLKGSGRGGPIGPDPAPDFTELSVQLGTFITPGSELRSEQQQQQQQQQQRRRFLNLETQLPEEQVVTKLSIEVKESNKIMKQGEK